MTYPVDTGFLVCNERTYPQLLQLFEDLAIPTAKSAMSFGLSVRLPNGRALEWAGTSLDTVFAQRRNLLSPRFVRNAARSGSLQPARDAYRSG